MDKKSKAGIAGILSFFVFIFVYYSPIPAIYLLKAFFGLKIFTKPPDHKRIKENILFLRNIDYNSEFSDGVLDIILPKNIKNRSIIFWAHGGGYIGGDKTIVERYLALLANEGYAVININYSLAPKSRYPVPLKQMEEAYVFIKNNAKTYDLNIKNGIYFGGDSAGAQIAAQFVNIQTDKDYMKKVNAASGKIKIYQKAEKKTINGTVLFCGPYNFNELIDPENNTMPLPFKKIGWAYFGNADPGNPNIALCNITQNIKKGYPPVFITDGNFLSFENQAKELVKALKKNKVYVKSVFYDKKEAILPHEYQFYMKHKCSIKTYNYLLDFLRQYSK